MAALAILGVGLSGFFGFLPWLHWLRSIGISVLLPSDLHGVHSVWAQSTLISFTYYEEIRTSGVDGVQGGCTSARAHC